MLPALCSLPYLFVRAEVSRRRQGPAQAVARFRARGLRRRPLSPPALARLLRVISALDRRLPGGGNCYRRALVELAVDPAMAGEVLHLGIRAGGGPGSGHAWLGDRREAGARYDVELAL